MTFSLTPPSVVAPGRRTAPTFPEGNPAVTAPFPEYLTLRLTQISTAIGRRDGDTVAGTIRQVAADGYPDTAADIAHNLAGRGLSNMVAAYGGGS